MRKRIEGKGRLVASCQAAVVAALMAPSAAKAEEPAPDVLEPVRAGGDAFTIQLPADTGYKATRTVTATKTDTDLLDVPQSVSVVNQDQIRDQAIASMADAVRYTPGLGFAQGEGNRDTPVFRGNSSTADFFVDGIRDDVQYFRDVYNVERVEIFRGPNAMIFGRGGVGGVINRVTRQADWDAGREVRVQGGSHELWRGTLDFNQPVTDAVSLRLTGLYDNAESYRDDVRYERWGLNPTASFKLGDSTLVQIGYEHFDDWRTADRGIPSYQGLPFLTRRSTFFGDPEDSLSHANVDAVNVAIEHVFSDAVTLRNRFRYSTVDKFYQNVFPGAVNAAGTMVSISAYNQATTRDSVINQTDLVWKFETGSISHTVLTGVEAGRQETDNLRLTGYFGSPASTVTSILAPVTNPNVDAHVFFRPSATDADNHGVVKFVGVYLQDQIEFSPLFEAVVGIRYDNFDAYLHNNRTGQDLNTNDDLWSPRASLIFKPVETMSLYASYSRTYLPRSGEQLASLTATNAALAPEKFDNYEIGAKWDVTSAIQMTAAIYQLDRTNVVIPDPADPTRSILAGAQRTRGFEFGASGNISEDWSIVVAYAYADGKFTKPISATVPAGAWLANLPKHNISVWNRYDILEWLGVGVGVIHQTRRFAATDNLVTLPGFTRVDAALFFDITDTITAQVNVENLLGEHYYVNAHNNNNITPGAPLTVSVTLGARF
ncbi:MAG: TonB-dependent receptor [Sphingomonadales bacterium]